MEGADNEAHHTLHQGVVIHSGYQLPPFTNRTLFSVKAHNLRNRVLNALLRIPGLKITDENAAIDGLGQTAESLVAQSFFHPFRIYETTHPSDTTKSWRSFRVRSGYVEFRPRFFDFTGTTNQLNSFLTDNYSYLTYVVDGTDGAQAKTDDVTLDFYTDRVISDALTMEVVDIGNVGDYGVATPGNGATFVLNGTPDTTSGVAASFWVEIADATGAALPSFQIKARMITGDIVSLNSRTQTFFPAASPYVIPIGWVLPRQGFGASPYDTHDLVVRQILDYHVINRYAPGPLNADSLGGIDGPTFFRGTWDGGDTEALNGSVFYPGDLVSVPTTVGGVDCINLYAHVGYHTETAAPPSGGRWIQIAGLT